MSEHFAQEPENVRGRPVAWVAFGVCVAIVVGTLIAYAILVAAIGTVRHPWGEPEAPSSLGVLRSSLIGEEAVRQRPALRPPLYDDYAWVDQDAGVIAVPLDVAVELYLEQQAARSEQGGTEP